MQRPVRLTLGLAHNPRASTEGVARIDAIAWLSGHAIRGIPEAARLEEEIRRLQRLCRDSGVSKADVFPPPCCGSSEPPKTSRKNENYG